MAVQRDTSPEYPSGQSPSESGSDGLGFAERAVAFLRPGCAPRGFGAWFALVLDSFRIVSRAVLMAVWLLFVYLLWLAVSALHLGRRKPLRVWRRRILRMWGRGALKLLGIRLVVEGPIPQPPFFLVANHMGYIDIVAIAATTGSVFIAKADMSTWPIFGYMMRTSQQLFIKREDRRDVSRAVAAVAEVYDEGDGMTIFAEGRCSDGTLVLPFRPGLFEAAARGGWPVHYGAIHYETAPGEPTASDTLTWWRWEPAQHMFARMLRVRRATATLRYCAEAIPPAGRKALASSAQAGVEALFTPMTEGVLPELPPPAAYPERLFRDPIRRPVAPVEAEACAALDE